MRANTLYQENTPKAWVHLDASGTPKIISNFNVSSVTEITGGVLRLSFNRAFASTAYIAIGMSGGAAGKGYTPHEDISGEKDTSNYPLRIIDSDGVVTAAATNYVVFWGPQ